MAISICASKKRNSICYSNNEILWLEIKLVTRACGCPISYFPSHQKQPWRLPFVRFHRPSFLLPFYVSFFPQLFGHGTGGKRVVPPFSRLAEAVHFSWWLQSSSSVGSPCIWQWRCWLPSCSNHPFNSSCDFSACLVYSTAETVPYPFSSPAAFHDSFLLSTF